MSESQKLTVVYETEKQWQPLRVGDFVEIPRLGTLYMVARIDAYKVGLVCVAHASNNRPVVWIGNAACAVRLEVATGDDALTTEQATGLLGPCFGEAEVVSQERALSLMRKNKVQ